MTEKSLVKYTGKDFNKYLSDKSVLELLDILKCLDDNKDYVGDSHNGEVGKFLKNKYPDIPVNNVEGFYSFYKSLNNKIAELADTKESAKRYLENASYQRELKELPRLMNKLERFSLDSIKPKFEAVMEYVYDAVMNQGFEMDYKNIEIFQIGSTDVLPKGAEVCINVNKESIEIDLSKKKNKKNSQELGIQLLALAKVDQSDTYFYPVQDIDSVVNEIKNFILYDDKADELIENIKTFFSLPKIMNEYLKEKISKLEKKFKDIK